MDQMLKYVTRDAIKTFTLALGFGIGFYLLNLFLHQRVMVDGFPDAKTLLHWDGGWYKNVVDNGYVLKDGPSNVVFFPLFPLVWKLLCVGPWGISFVNLLLFSAAFAVFSSMLFITTSEKLIILSLPSLYFVFIPYSEAVFILCVSVMMWAIHHHRMTVLWTSLFLLALSRPVAMIMAPAFIITELLLAEPGKFLAALKRSMHYVIPSALGTLSLFCYQYFVTGAWFGFFEKEKEVWGHKFAWPILPFNSMYGPYLLWLNATAMFLCFIALMMLVGYAIKWMKGKPAENRLLTLSCLYMVAMLCKTVFFNPIWVHGTTNVYDVHRYVFASPFFWFFLFYFIKDRTFKPRHYFGVIVLSNAFWLLLGSYLHLQSAIYFNFGTVLVLTYMMYTRKQLEWPVIAIVVLNVILQVQLFQGFIGDNIYPG